MPKILYSNGLPKDSQGKDGDIYIETSTGFVFRKNGSWSVVSENSTEYLKTIRDKKLSQKVNKRQITKNKLAELGIKAANTILSGNGKPSKDDGAYEDFYIDKESYSIYFKDKDGWGLGVSLIGQNGESIKGEVGENGKDGKDGRDGIDGLDGNNGKDGKDGKDGREVELSAEGNSIVWRYKGSETWKSLVDVSPSQAATGVFREKIIRHLKGLVDVNISSPQDGETLTYNAQTERWENGASSSGGVPYTGATQTVNLNSQQLGFTDFEDNLFYFQTGQIGETAGDGFLGLYREGQTDPALWVDRNNGYVHTNSLYTDYINADMGASLGGDITFTSSPIFENDAGLNAAFFGKNGANGFTGMVPDTSDGAEELNLKLADRAPALIVDRNANDSADGVIIGGVSGNLYGDSVLDVTGPVRMVSNTSFFSTGGLAGGYSLYVSSSDYNKFGITDSSDSTVFQILGNSSDYDMIMRIGNIEFDGNFYFEVDQANLNATVVGGDMRAERMYVRDQINGDYAGITHEDEGYIFNTSSLTLASIQAGVGYLYGVYADGGTASVPAYSRQTDTNTGIYFPAADQIAISTGGTARITATTTAITLGLETTVDNLKTSGSSGIALKNSGGTTVVTFGSSGTTNVSFAGAVNANSIGTLTTALSVANGGTGRATSTTAYGLIAAGTTATGAQQTLAAGATTEILVGGGASALPVWTTATGTGAPVRAGSPTLTNPNIVGTATNDSAAAGSVGQYVESNIAIGSAVALTSGIEKTITSISLTAGDWDVQLNAGYTGGGTTSVTQLGVSISLVNNTGDYTAGRANVRTHPGGSLLFSLNQNNLVVPSIRLSLSATTTVYFVAYASFTISTCSAFGLISARRVR